MKNYFNGYKYAKILMDAIIYTILIWVVIFLLVYDNAIVYDVSMQPTLNATSGVSDNDMVCYNKLEKYGISDIVIVKVDDELIVKRVIAVGGDKIRYVYDNNSGVYDLYINNQKIVEEYIKEDITLDGLINSNNSIKFADITDESGYNPFALLKRNEPENFDEDGNYVIPKDMFFAMGDNRIYSTDSKSHGAYSNSSVVGVVDLIIYHDDNAFLKILDFMFW